MSITHDEIKKIAHLARIKITEEEADATIKKLSGILNLIEDMKKVDTTNISPMSHGQLVTQRLREDIVTEKNQREKLQKIAPEVNGGLYIVPQVIE
ncbi:MAG: Asp-tRNA(Asn)/Glu-tRNA(Gln) amidotransferase subunit GatC [Candidatus Methylopumilus sp.]|jgi:aspartyl-tRNA(Asn)/glutamyl-tRNA(Gln) amidotransferase subunit C|nr:Asp-tRNA(Asn)/Glu-tRNA(Gln) amidotransferase subunit GatC [Candidatus Methylopumilus sp.]